MGVSAPPTVAYLDLQAAHLELAAELEEASRRVLGGGSLVLGPEVEAFEREFARFVGARHCVGLASGLDALTLTLEAWEIGPGDEVLVPSCTFVATWLAVARVGAHPVPVEPDPATGNIDPTAVGAALTDRTRAVVPVHLHGLPADVDAIREGLGDHDALILEDAAQAHGASLRGRPVGSLGDAAAWSFYPAKNLGALGDGGAVTTDDDALAARLRSLRNYGLEGPFRHERRGSNSRLDEVQAAFLRVKLTRLEEWNERRRDVARAYLSGLRDLDVDLPHDPPDADHAWHVFAIGADHRDGVRRGLEERGIGTHCHYPVPPHLQGAFRGLGLGPGALPRAERIAGRTLSLPMGPHMSDGDVERVGAAVREVLR